MLSGGGGNKLSQSSAEGLGLEYLSSGDQTLKTPFAGAINQDYQKGSDEEQWDLTTALLNGEHQIREMYHEVSYQHFNGGYGGYQPGKDTQGNSGSAKKLYDSSEPEQATKLNCPHIGKYPEQLLGSVKGEEEPNKHSKDKI
jgi:hypothetical protein